MKKTHRIKHTEKLVGYFYVEADTPEEALEEYHFKVTNGEIDFSDLEMTDSEDVAEEWNEDGESTHRSG